MGNDDQVRRLYRFRHEHPEWQIISPGDIRSVVRSETGWTARGPEDVLHATELRVLLDDLEELVNGRKDR